MKQVKIAILGATSHIAKGLIENFLKRSESDLYLFARKIDKVKEFLTSFINGNDSNVYEFSDFENYDYDAIINCVGYGTPSKVIGASNEILEITEKYDNIALEYLTRHPHITYINFSSGAVYGKSFENPADENTFYQLDVNSIGANDYYAISKIYSEAKHRSMAGLNIVDLRVFAYFSKYIDQDGKFFIADLVKCLISKSIFKTNSHDMFRDYVHPDDLFQLVCNCIEQERLNGVFDVYSKKPVSKFEILEHLKINYGLKYSIEEDVRVINATGSKNMYFTNNFNAKIVRYNPQYTSLESIDIELQKILDKDGEKL